MNNELHDAVEILNKNGQEHLLSFYEELDDLEKERLIHQILSIDFDMINKLYSSYHVQSPIDSSNVSPMPYIKKSYLSKEELSFYTSIGLDIIKNRQASNYNISRWSRYPFRL